MIVERAAGGLDSDGLKQSFGWPQAMRTMEKRAEDIEKEVPVRGSHLPVVVFVIFLKSGFSINEELAISCSHFCATGRSVLRLQVLQAEAFGTALHAPVVELGAGQPECCRTGPADLALPD
jgi:hypothetical protein